jgi:beta-galactosidase
MRVLSVETIREDCCEPFTWNHTQYQSCIWREQIETKEANIIATHPNGEPAILCQQRFIYLGTLTNRQFLLDFFQQQCQKLGIKTYCWGKDIRVCQRGNLMFAFNYSEQQQTLPLDAVTKFLLGDKDISGHGISVWQIADT